ncbi:MAG: TetR/AcrR family transcriptional regulator [Caldilineaceae bacterium]|nr:TetR/AcrR family transcriptional regulator [Caldilineaceae bacterium]
MPRGYKQKKRAKDQEDTRQRIIEATISLHQEIGGPGTTISAIAERAGVERATVYRHFPDEYALLRGCTGHYLASNPPPDPAAWARIDDRTQRLRIALTDIYGYHRQTEVMMGRAVIDIPQMPVLREVLAPMIEFWQTVRDLLAEPWAVEENADLFSAAIGHAIAFQTWQSLVRDQGVEDEEAVALILGMIYALGAKSVGDDSPDESGRELLTITHLQ